MPEYIDDFNLTSFSIVEHCPYCGAKFNEEGKTRDGKDCTHPTKMTMFQGFSAVAGTGKKKSNESG
jgi:hypothetical protein